MADIYNEIFRRSSKTYFYSSILFPKEIKDKVARLYAFVRIADDFVDSNPQNIEAYLKFKNGYYSQKSGKLPNDNSIESGVISAFVELEKSLDFNPNWVAAFFQSMDMDLESQDQKYITIEDTERYIYGSASVIGLFMSKILELDPIAYQAAESLGMAFQYINFIRDINEDIDLKRNYFPLIEMKRFGLEDLTFETTNKKKVQFKEFIKLQIEHYYKWQKIAETGFYLIPKKYLIAIKTASDMYKWTAEQIFNDPFIVYKTKIKPKKRRILLRGALNAFSNY